AAAVDAPHSDVALQLKEDLVARVDVEIVPRVRAADDLVDELALGKNFLVGDGAAEQALVLFDPAHQVQRHDVRHHRLLPVRSRAAAGGAPAPRQPAARTAQ